jgi:uncharacterized protein (DUF2267 family)
MANETREPISERAEQRHESRASSTYKAFLKDLCALGGFDEQFAERAAVSVLSKLQERIYSQEAEDLEAQLPLKLRELLQQTRRHEGKPEAKFGKDEFIEMIGDDLGKSPDEAEAIVRTVFATVRSGISEGEANDVADQLPQELAAM